ncbi:glycosyltransferase family 4 protein [Candidatus Stoquefichus sp. SB1]|uniref:glycosyltransferase family 4 protein n=1 Tax=Candidatus Stoquefichus sp. SB1 TaxID=1658109 RepID=UPI00067F4E55|nr:glycosyltransferase family 4 protein [Candidatus Stoquefichus sp. SB1]
MKKMLMIASVPSMIGQFNMNNIQILINLGFEVEVACDWSDRSVWTDEKVNDLKEKLSSLNVICHQIDYSRSPFNIGCHIKSYRQTLKLLRENNYEFVHCHTPIASAVTRLACKKTNTKCIYTAHGFHFYKGAPIKNWIIFYPIEKWLSRYTDVLITINMEDYNRAKEKFKMKQLEYVPGVGIDLSKFQIKNFNRDEYRSRLGLKSDDFVILSVGELNKNKNHEIVIKAIAKLGYSNIKYLIAGQGDLDRYLIELANHLGIGDKVNLLGFRKDIPELLNSSDLYILPSLREGLNVSLLEAMASGLPCIGSKIRGNVDLKDVDLFKVKDEENLVSKINSVYQGRERISNNSELKKFSNKAINHQLSKIYEKLVVNRD